MDRLAELTARQVKLDLNIRALAARERERRRRDDARAKIILGSALLVFFRREAIAERALMPRLLPLMAERDRELIVRVFGTGD